MLQTTVRGVTRRTVLRQLAIVAGGVLVLPTCLQQKSKSSLLLKNITIAPEEEALVADLSEAILPATDTPGAKDLYTHLFALKMIDDCSTKEEQQRFVQGLAHFDAWSKKTAGVLFTNANKAQQERVLQILEKNQNVPEEIDAFYKQLKALTVQAYLSSKFYLTDVQPYQLTPGYYHGCVPVRGANKKAYKV